MFPRGGFKRLLQSILCLGIKLDERTPEQKTCKSDYDKQGKKNSTRRQQCGTKQNKIEAQRYHAGQEHGLSYNRADHRIARIHFGFWYLLFCDQKTKGLELAERGDEKRKRYNSRRQPCLLYTSDAADER